MKRRRTPLSASRNTVAVTLASATAVVMSALAPLAPAAAADPPGSVVLQSTGAVQTVTVPVGVYSVGVQLAGGGGGAGDAGLVHGGSGGLGALVEGYLSVSPGTVLTVYVGGEGGHYGTDPDGAHGGWGGPATGGASPPARAGTDATGGGGGGATTLMIGDSVIGIAAGGGGGGGANNFSGGAGGNAGDPAHDGYHGGGPSGGDGYGLGGHAGLAPTSTGLEGGCGSCGSNGFGDGYGGGGGGGALGGQGGHGGNASGGGGGAGTSLAAPTLTGASIGTKPVADAQTGYAAFDWVLGTSLRAEPTDSSPTVGASLDIAVEVLAADGSVLAEITDARIWSDGPGDVVQQHTLTLGTAGARTVTVTTPDGALTTTLALNVRAPLPNGDVVLTPTGETQTVVVPDGVTAMTVTVTGAGGGGSSHTTGGGGRDASAGSGAVVTGTIAVTPGAVISADVGGQGGHYGTSPGGNVGGWGGSAPGGSSRVTTNDLGQKYGGGGGGGASTLTMGGNPLIVAAGGGGAGSAWGTYSGGHGGNAGVTADDGNRGNCPVDEYGDGGHGASEPTGSGSQGGMRSGPNQPSAGGGGGGYRGGQGGHGGSGCSGGGGAGETFVQSFSVTGITVATAAAPGDGAIALTWHQGATLAVTASATSVYPGTTVTVSGRLIGADGSPLGDAPSLRLTSPHDSDTVDGSSIALTAPGRRLIEVTVPGSPLRASVVIDVRRAATLPSPDPAASPSVGTARALASTGGADSTRLLSWGAAATLLGAALVLMRRVRRHPHGKSD